MPYWKSKSYSGGKPSALELEIQAEAERLTALRIKENLPGSIRADWYIAKHIVKCRRKGK